MVSDSEDELPDIPYTSAFSTKWKVPAWARSRSRSGGRGSAAAAEVAVLGRSRSGGRGSAAAEVEVSGRSRSGGRGSACEVEVSWRSRRGERGSAAEHESGGSRSLPRVQEWEGFVSYETAPKIAEPRIMKKVHLIQYNEDIREIIVELEAYRKEKKASEEKIETEVIETGVWNLNEYVLEIGEVDINEEETDNAGDVVQTLIYVMTEEVDEQDGRVSEATICDHTYASKVNLSKKHRTVKVNKDEAVKKIKHLEDQKNHNDAEFARKIKKFKHKEYIFHVCSCGKKFVTVNSARAHAANKCNLKKFIRSGVHCKCLLCDIRFKSKKERCKHVKKQHPLSFPCTKCGQKFNGKKAWNRHIKACHMGMKSYQCKTCMYSTNWRGNMFKHKKTHKKKILPALFQARKVNMREQFGRQNEDMPKDLKDSKIILLTALDTGAILTVVANDKMITMYEKSSKPPGLIKLKSLSMPFPVLSMAAMGSRLALCSSTGQVSILAFTHRGDIVLELSKTIVLQDEESVIKTVWIEDNESILGVVSTSGIKIFDLQYKHNIVFLHAFTVPVSAIVDASLTKTDLQIESEGDNTVEDNLRWLDGTVAAIKESVPGTYCFIDGQSSTHLIVKLPVGVKDLIIRKTGEEVFSVASLQVSFLGIDAS